jgi:hypothetical protein
MTDPIINQEIMSAEQLEALKQADETVFDMLATYAKTVEEEKQLEAWLEQDSNYQHLQTIRANISELEDRIKKDMKETSCTKYENAGYEAVMIVRHGKPEITWDLHAIKTEPWAAAVIIETVDKAVFDLLVKSGRIEKENIELYCQTEPGTESKAVTIRKVEDKKP